MVQAQFITVLRGASEIDITITGRKSGQAITLPIWFVHDEEKLYLLPVKGASTQWYKNLIETPTIILASKGQSLSTTAILLTDTASVGKVVKLFQDKYSADTVNRLYSGFDVAAEMPLK